MRQEKPRHLKYLNEFRTQQCLLFIEQQCQFHRPYTCFHWHFPNQKRRRPFKRPDGTFNYNPDVYCDKYDETSGSCADGDECPYAHRNAGDTERRYHPRYFKTGNCIYETMENGACVKNGLHCAFAHGPDDIRLPVYDIREVQDASSKFTVNLPASLEKERVLSEDPKWNEMFHVLACYKTELCKKPPRMCRQGYSCPFYHNGKDKRRAPDKFLYRSTPCPIVRPGDEWQDSTLCDTGDACIYCHTRTEQQFHPEIYKSTKCNDVLNSGYCPRGPFCAFAHCDSEMSIGRDFSTNVQQEQPGFITESNNNNNNNNNNISLSSNNISLSSNSVTAITTTAISSIQYHRHIPSDVSLMPHSVGGTQNQQQYSVYSPLIHPSISSAINSNLRILGTSTTSTITTTTSTNTNTIPATNNNNNSNNNLPPNLMSNLNTNFSNMKSIIASSPQQQQQQQILQRTTSSQHHHYHPQQHQQHLMSFPSPVEFNKSVNTSDRSGRCTHIPTNPLMSSMISPLGPAPNQSCSRGRRLARCTSPRTASMWPAFNLVTNPGNDRQHFTQMPGSSNSDARIGACSAFGGVLSPSAVSSTCSPNQSSHFSHSRSRPIPGQYHNVVLTHSMATTGGGGGGGGFTRDTTTTNNNNNTNKGRHRSGSSSMSSEIGQYPMNVKELISPSTAYLDSISTYPGRCGPPSHSGGGGCVMGNLSRTIPFSTVGDGDGVSLLSTSSQKQTMPDMTTSKPVVLLGQFSGIYQNMMATRSKQLQQPQQQQQQPNIIWDNLVESTSSNMEQQYFSPSCSWSTMNLSNAFNNNSNNNTNNETENDFNQFLDQYHMPIGIASSSSIGVCDDTSRDSGLVLDMTLPPTSPLESNCGGVFNNNLDTDLLSQLTQSQQQQQYTPSFTTSDVSATAALFDDITHTVVNPRFSEDNIVFHSLSDDSFLSTHSISEDQDQDHHHHPHSSSFSVIVTSNSSGVDDCSSLPNFYSSNPVSIPGRVVGNNNNNNYYKDLKSLQIHSGFLDPPITCCQSDNNNNNLSRFTSIQSTNLLQQTDDSNLIRSGNLIKSNQRIKGWPSSFIDGSGHHRHSSPLSSPVSLNINNNNNNNNRFSSIVGTPLGRTNHPISSVAEVDLNVSSLASSASSSGSTSAISFGAIGSRVHHYSLTSESTDHPDTSHSTRSQPYSEYSTQGGIPNMSSTSSPNQVDVGRTQTSSRIFSHSINENFTNLPQSPILLSSPFSNPGCDLERLTLRRELDEVKQLLDSKEGEVEVLKKQRDFVTEHLRDSLGVIRRLFHSLNISPSTSTDLFKPLFIDTEINNISSEPSTGCCYAQSLSSESNPCEKFKTCMQTSPGKCPSPIGPVDSISQNPLQQQEALAALFANPLVSALLNSHNNDIHTLDDISRMKSGMQFRNWNLPNNDYDTDGIQQHHDEASMHKLKESFNNPSLLSFTGTGTGAGDSQAVHSDSDDDDLFSASGLLSLSNQESCDLDQQIDENNTGELLLTHHSLSFDASTITTTTTTTTTTTVSEPMTTLSNITTTTPTTTTTTTTFEEESIVTTSEMTNVEKDPFWLNTIIISSTTVTPIPTSTSINTSSTLAQNSTVADQLQDNNDNVNNNNNNHCCCLSSSSLSTTSKLETDEKQSV
ncbi:unnamed protein product [Schistosoma turkestanicum]|nr:unnamed protein product [Schistosoma turkestanicum]